MKTAANISTALSAPQTLLQELWDWCLANVSAEHIRQAVRVQDLPLKRACATLACCTKCTGNIKQLIREDVIRRGFARVAVD